MSYATPKLLTPPEIFRLRLNQLAFNDAISSKKKYLAQKLANTWVNEIVTKNYQSANSAMKRIRSEIETDTLLDYKR